MEWIKVFSSGEEARQRLRENTPQLLVVGERSICLVMRGGLFYAIENKCSHNGESLSKGLVNFLGEVVCPWHGYRFSLKTGRECAERSRDLQIYPMKENEEGVFVGL
jgi:nitrite reductase/ring-hydroxylating ferredoxin subunit